MKRSSHRTAIERKRAMLEFVQKQGLCTIDELADRYGISRVTVHRILSELEKENKVIKVRGGVERSPKSSLERDYDKRLREHAEQKREIAQKALKLIKENSTVFLDASTSTYYLAEAIANQITHRLSVVTNSPMVVQALLHCPNIHTIDTGGGLVHQLNALAGPITVDVLKRLNFDIVFCSAGAVSLESGMMTAQTALVEVLLTAMQSGRKCILLVDSSKFERVAPLTVAPLSNLTRIISDAGLSDEYREEYARHGVQVD